LILDAFDRPVEPT